MDGHSELTRQVVIAGRDLAIAPYTLSDIMRVRQQARALLDGLYDLVITGNLPDYEEVMTLLASHIELTIDLVATSTGVDRCWIEALNAIDGELLLACWWGVVGPSLVQMAIRRLMVQQQTLAGVSLNPGGQPRHG